MIATERGCEDIKQVRDALLAALKAQDMPAVAGLIVALATREPGEVDDLIADLVRFRDQDFSHLGRLKVARGERL